MIGVFEAWVREHRLVAGALAALVFAFVVLVGSLASSDAYAPLMALVGGSAVFAAATVWSLTHYSSVDDEEADELTA